MQGVGIFFIKYYSIHVYKNNNNNLDKRKKDLTDPCEIPVGLLLFIKMIYS